MKKYIFAALFGAAFMLNTASAQAEERYVVILKEAPVVRLFDADDGVINSVDNVYVVDSLMSAYALAPSDNVEAIFPDEVAYLFDESATLSADAPVIEQYPNGTNDIYYADQWYLPYINISSAWSRGFDGSGVRVGIVDTGIDLYHPDLPSPAYYYNAVSGGDTTNVQDELGHGTWVTGVVAAHTNNDSYISGMCQDVELVSIKVATAAEMSTADLLMGFKKALEYDCDVINMSLGFTEEASPWTTRYMREFVEDAVNDGVIITAAAGNDGDDAELGGLYHYPASYDNVVSVGSIGWYTAPTGVDANFERLSIPTRRTDGTYYYSVIYPDAPSLFTQHNDKVTCAAPGYSIMTTAKNQTVMRKNGTSFASPMVASAAIIAKQMNPGITAPEFVNALQMSCDDVYTEGYDNYTGYGKLNIARLLEYLENGAITSTGEPESTEVPEATESPIPTETPEPTAEPTPVPTPTPIPTPTSSITKAGEQYVIQAVYDELGTDARVFAAVYKDEKLTTVRSNAVKAGSTGTKIYFSYDGEMDYVQVYIWAFDENNKLTMIPLAEKFTIE